MIEALWGILIAVYQTDQPSGSERTPMDAKVYELINDQINKELYSAYLYLAFADYYEEEGLSGYANYFEIQAAEERDHALIFRKYLHENGEKVRLLAIDQPEVTFSNFLEPLEAAMEHEQYVTSLIHDIYAAALEAHDYRAQKFLGWFIDEQMEEEDNADTMITNMKLFGGDPKGLYDLDRECAARVYSTPSPLAAE
jgi:ferritin